MTNTPLYLIAAALFFIASSIYSHGKEEAGKWISLWAAMAMIWLIIMTHVR